MAGLSSLTLQLIHFHSLKKLQAMKIILSGTPVSAEYANQIGIVSELAKPGGALETALSIASELLKNSPSAMMLAKEAIQRCMFNCLSFLFFL